MHGLILYFNKALKYVAYKANKRGKQNEVTNEVTNEITNEVTNTEVANETDNKIYENDVI